MTLPTKCRKNCARCLESECHFERSEKSLSYSANGQRSLLSLEMTIFMNDIKIPADLPEKISQKIRSGGKIRRIVVDREKCIGANSCVAVAPGVFQLDDENLAYVVDPDSTDEDTILMAAQSCPVLAILLYDEHGKKIFPEE